MKKFLVFILLYGFNSIWAQNNPDPYKFTSLVDLHEFPSVGATGNLDAQIPLYTISNKGLNIPIALNYDQIGNSNVFYIGNQFGDAWVLSASGTIRRECADRPTATLVSSVVMHSACAGTYTQVTYRNHSLQNDEYFYSINPSVTSRSKPDIYTFSFLGLTGKFVINKQGGQYVAEIKETSDFVKITIDGSPSGDDYNFKSITITDKNGYRYKYASPTNINQNQSNKLTFATGLLNIPSDCTLEAGFGDTPYEGVELVGGSSGGTKNGNGLISTQIIPGTSRFWENMELTEIYDKNNNLLISYEYDTTGFSNSGGFQWVNGLATMQSYQKLYLKKINIINQGSINFVNNYATNSNNVVNSYTSDIEINDLKNNLIKKVKFEYLVTTLDNIKYLKDFKDNSYGLSFNKRLLSAVKEYNNTSQDFLKTTIEYKNTAITNTNVVVDRYGFLTKVGYCFSHQHYSKADYKADSYMLQKIKYPTGGAVIYKFEPNTFSHSLYNTDMMHFNYDNHIYIENNTLIRSGNTATFTANAGDTIYVLNRVPNHSLYLYKKVSGYEEMISANFNNIDGQNPLTEDSCKHLLTSFVLPPSENNQYVFRYNSTLASTSGLKVYNKTNSSTYYNFRYAEGSRIAKIATFKDYVDKDILNNPNGEDLAEKVVVFDYSDTLEPNTSSGRVRTPASPKQELLPFNVIYDEVTTTVRGVGKQYAKYGFPYNSNWDENIRTDVKESKVYDIANQLLSQSTYTYTYDAPKMFITSSTVSTKNYEGAAFTTNSAYSSFNLSNRQLTSSINEDNLGKITKSEFDYQTINNAVLNTQQRNFIDNSLIEQVLNTYDTAGNIIKTEFKTPEMSTYEKIGNENTKYIDGYLMGYVQPDGTPVTLIYGYLRTQIIAKLINVDPIVFYSGSYQYLLTNFDTYSTQYNPSYSEANLKTALNSLRTTFPNALVTTYTYKPMVGVSSITDENGKTTTYEYDTFNRLATVKDYLGNILKEYKYNFTN